ncbi:MAG: dienelactone hydrolase family protein [Deltaproteobacteria bacterium]|nr:dienelactone hydrolase family protein [Deltaproteobacteria bacterium]
MDSELTKYNKPHEFYVYKDISHSFMDPHHPDRYVERSDKESWARGLKFLRRYLG